VMEKMTVMMTVTTPTSTMNQVSRSQVDLEIIISLTYFIIPDFHTKKRCNIRKRLYIVALVFLPLHLFLLLV
jgi:hypothetical protein